MKKYIAISTSFLITLLVPLAYVSAQLELQFKSPIQSKSVSDVMLAFFKVLIELGAVVVTLAIVYAGFMFVAAKGNPEQLSKAKTTLYWTIIGSLVLLGAQVIATIITNTIKQL